MLEVVVPEGVAGGEALNVTSPEGDEFEVTVPEGLVPGMCFLVDLPVQERPASGAEEVVMVEVPEGVEEHGVFIVEAPWGGAFEVSVPPGLGPGATMEVALPRADSALAAGAVDADAGAVDADAGAAAAASETEGSDTEPCGRFGVGQAAEVYRSDGTWSLATVTEYDMGGGTYTVELEDGRCKYFVEEEELRVPRFVYQPTVALEFIFFSGGGVDAKALL